MLAAMKHSLIALALALTPLAAAQAESFDMADIVQAEVLPGWRTPSGTWMAALHLTLSPGWKTYWRVPGEAGIPPLFDIAASTNIAALAVHWPTPHVFEIGRAHV